jgi:hypothetical protein
MSIRSHSGDAIETKEANRGDMQRLLGQLHRKLGQSCTEAMGERRYRGYTSNRA